MQQINDDEMIQQLCTLMELGTYEEAVQKVQDGQLDPTNPIHKEFIDGIKAADQTFDKIVDEQHVMSSIGITPQFTPELDKILDNLPPNTNLSKPSENCNF